MNSHNFITTIVVVLLIGLVSHCHCQGANVTTTTLYVNSLSNNYSTECGQDASVENACPSLVSALTAYETLYNYTSFIGINSSNVNLEVLLVDGYYTADNNTQLYLFDINITVSTVSPATTANVTIDLTTGKPLFLVVEYPTFSSNNTNIQISNINLVNSGSGAMTAGGILSYNASGISGYSIISLNINNCIISNISSTGQGAIVYYNSGFDSMLSNLTLTITNTQIYNTSSVWDGVVIYGAGDINVNIVSSTITNSYGLQYIPPTPAPNTTLVQLSQQQQQQSLIYIGGLNSQINIIDSTFSNNFLSYGSIVYVPSPIAERIVVKGSVFTGNVALAPRQNDISSIIYTSLTGIIVDNSQFTNNTVPYIFNSTGPLFITGSQVSDNQVVAAVTITDGYWQSNNTKYLNNSGEVTIILRTYTDIVQSFSVNDVFSDTSQAFILVVQSELVINSTVFIITNHTRQVSIVCYAADIELNNVTLPHENLIFCQAACRISGNAKAACEYSESSSSEHDKDKDKNTGLTGGKIVGIIMGAVIGGGLLFLGSYILVKRYQNRKKYMQL